MSGRAFRRAVNKEYELDSKRKSAEEDPNQVEEEFDYEQRKTNLFDLVRVQFQLIYYFVFNFLLPVQNNNLIA